MRTLSNNYHDQRVYIVSSGPFGNCKTAELHKNLKLQAYGAMIAIDKRSHQISACSNNIKKFIGKSPEELLNTPWSSVLTPDLIDSMFIASNSSETNIGAIVTTELNGVNVEVSNHTLGNYCMVEIEPASSKDNVLAFSQKVAFLENLAAARTEEASAKALMNEIAGLIDFDRVMLYKFLPGWHGEVIAEVNKKGIEGYLGLRFPEGDIPANARRLFTMNWQRLIANVAEETADILIANDTVDLDLSYSQLRAIHPVHIKYLSNMGVQASFSISLVCNGKLWGMIACHQLSAKVLSIGIRQSCEELARTASLHMNNIIIAKAERERHDFRVGISSLRAALNVQQKGVTALNSHIGDIREIFRATGAWHSFKGIDHFSGKVPDSVSLSTLENWLAKFDLDDIMAVSQIPEALSDNASLLRFASGILYIPIGKDEFILLFRPEQIEHVEWAGKPHSLMADDSSTLALTPRSSFQKWSQELRGHSEPWESADLEAANILRDDLIDYLQRSEMEEMALRDPLTSLANRMQFERNLDNAIRHSIADNSIFAVFMIDLDNFKPVNDTMGHASGDELLIQVAQRISALLRDNDSVARLGGDEFAVILRNIKEQQMVDDIAERILNEMKRNFTIDGRQVQIGASIGISIFPNDASNEEELLHDADLALYKVKEEGRNNFKRFDKTMLTGEGSTDSIRENLLAAFDQKQFIFKFQPIINIVSRKLVGFEAFSVWLHPEKGALAAREYIDLISKAQLSSQWGEWGLESLFQCQSQWARSGLQMVPIGLNIDAKQFLNMDIEGICKALMDKYQISASWLRLDLEEQTLLTNATRIGEKITNLAAQGILVNVDHFGRGLMSLKQLTELKLNTLKVPGKLLAHFHTSHKVQAQMAILKSISNVLKVPIIATQIETSEAIRAAQDNNITRSQGFIFGELLSAEETITWINDAEAMLEKLKL